MERKSAEKVTKEDFNNLMLELSKDLGFSRADDVMFSLYKEMKTNSLDVMNQLGGNNYLDECISKLDKTRVKEMNEEEVQIYIGFSMQEQGKDMGIDWGKVDEQYSKGTLTKVLKNRCDAVKVNLSKLAGIFLSMQLRSFGEVTIYAAYLYWQTKFSNIEEINMEAISRIFPFGFPTELELQEIWDKQKVSPNDQFRGNNMLDMRICYE